MLNILFSAISAIAVGVCVSVLTYFIDKWLDKHFRK